MAANMRVFSLRAALAAERLHAGITFGLFCNAPSDRAQLKLQALASDEERRRGSEKTDRAKERARPISCPLYPSVSPYWSGEGIVDVRG